MESLKPPLHTKGTSPWIFYCKGIDTGPRYRMLIVLVGLWVNVNADFLFSSQVHLYYSLYGWLAALSNNK